MDPTRFGEDPFWGYVFLRSPVAFEVDRYWNHGGRLCSGSSLFLLHLARNVVFAVKRRPMVGASEAAQMERLESQVDNGGGGAWEYLCLVRKLKARRSDKVLKHGLSILNDHRARSKLGAEG
ncbi:hypothetical protein BHE74_00018797 [Ensete ventricosum]|nr:hypothetical protein GW17_00050216 [Ensete ventricosum]RWW73341.1 hypothetical protein BHE74_00018797 [Ensete ventricosum]